MMNISLEKYFGILSSSSSTSSAAASSSKKTDNLETVFNKVFSPISKQADPNLIAQLVACVNQNSKENASLAVELALNKLKSIQEWEVLISLQVQEALVRGCGEPIHELIARYRFLNEIIKLISPKFYGKTSSEKVKTKCIELIYSWSKGLEQKPKIKIAYEMLKMQGLIKQDPIVDELVVNVIPRSHSPVFQEEEKLASLLKSKNPKDLELANQLIKEMVKKDEIRLDKSMTRANELEQINNNIKLLNEMLTKYDQKTSNLSEKETIRFLYDELEKIKPKIIQIASEIDENDDSIGTVIKSNDECESVLNKFKSIFRDDFSAREDTHHADDELVDISSNLTEKVKSNSPQVLSSSSKSSIKELEDLLIFDTSASSTTFAPTNTQANIFSDNSLDLLKPEILHKSSILPTKASDSSASAKSFNLSAFEDLNVLDKVLVEHSLKPESNQNTQSMKLNELIAKSQEHKQIN